MSSTFKDDFLKPFLVLVIICIVASALLAVTNALTADVIAANEKAAMEATRRAVLPGASDFEEISIDGAEVDSIFKETTGLGYVITASSKGYGGNVTVTVGISADGQIVGVKANVSSETQGVGTKAGKDDYLAQYMGDPANAENAELITSATFSSSAVKTSVNAAIAAYNTVCKEAQ